MAGNINKTPFSCTCLIIGLWSLTIWLWSLILCSCSTSDSDREYDGPMLDPKLSLSSFVCLDSSTHKVQIEVCPCIFSKEVVEKVKDPVIYARVNGGDKILIDSGYTERWVNKEEGNQQKVKDYYLKFDSKVEIGDEIELFTTYKNYGDLYMKDVVPDTGTIVKVEPNYFNKDNKSYLRTKITVQDKKGQDNYYRLIIRGASATHGEEFEGDVYPSTIKIDEEPLLNSIFSEDLASKYENYYKIFTDEKFKDTTYTLNVYIPFNRSNPLGGALSDAIIQVEIQSLSKAYYQFLRSIILVNNQTFQSEPVTPFSNVQGGFGILGCYSTSKRMLRVE